MSGGFFRVIAAVALVGLLAIVGVGIYDAGVGAGLAEAGRTAVASGEPAPVVYYPGPYYHGWGYGHGWGFGIFGFFFLIFGIFLFFGLLRAAFGWGRWGGGGVWNRNDGPRGHLDEWHRQAHDQPKDS
jgi:tellurite resistance protein TehA-like permease